MKKLLMTLLLCVTTLGAKAQFEKNTTYFSTSLTGLSMSYSNQEKFTLGVDVLGGFFVEQSWMLYGRFGYGHTQVSCVIIFCKMGCIWDRHCNTSIFLKT